MSQVKPMIADAFRKNSCRCALSQVRQGVADILRKTHCGHVMGLRAIAARLFKGKSFHRRAMRLKSRRQVLAMTLMELVVTMTLASGLLGSIFYWIGAQNKLSRELAHKRDELYAQEKLELELVSSLGKLCLKPRMDEKEKSSGFKLEAGELHFYFKSSACVYPEMNFMQKGLLRLEGENLVLTSTPCPEFWPSEIDGELQNRKLLATGIDQLEFYFLYLASVGPLSRKMDKTPAEQEPVLMGLVQEADALREDLPVATVLKLQKGAQTLHFAIWREDATLIHQLEGTALP